MAFLLAVCEPSSCMGNAIIIVQKTMMLIMNTGSMLHSALHTGFLSGESTEREQATGVWYHHAIHASLVPNPYVGLAWERGRGSLSSHIDICARECTQQRAPRPRQPALVQWGGVVASQANRIFPAKIRLACEASRIFPAKIRLACEARGVDGSRTFSAAINC